MTDTSFPPLPLEEWQDTKTTLHLYAQIVGKVRLHLHPPLNHWWHVPLYVSTRGLTTGPIPYITWDFELEFDFRQHALVVHTSSGETRTIALGGTVADFYAAVMGELDDLGIRPRIVAKPFDTERVGSDIPFAKDTVHGSYDREYVERFWRILVGVDGIFRTFRGRFTGKSSPVHFFWHSFDLAVTRFSGRPAAVAADADSVTREAYSHEVISAGFWAGDINVPEAAFYAYAAPEPKGLGKTPLEPPGAWWQDQGTSSMALYRYSDFRESDDPKEALLSFLQSSYDAAARLGGWPADLVRGEKRG